MAEDSAERALAYSMMHLRGRVGVPYCQAKRTPRPPAFKPLEQLATCTQQAAEKRWRGSQGKAKAGEKAQFTVV